MYDLVLKNGRVYIEGQYHDTFVYIKDGKIAALTKESFDAKDVYDCHGHKVFPGIIDPHTHFALHLGHITSVDDFSTGTEAAAFGGVTTIVDFLEPVDTIADLRDSFHHRSRQAECSCIDVKFHACLKDPKDDLDELTDVMLEYGLNTVKIFTTYSDSGRRTYDPDIITLLELSKKKDFTLACHIENDEMITIDDVSPYMALPDNRPTRSETSEALKLAGFAEQTNGNLYMVHCSSGDTIEALKKQYSSILHKNMIVESCPHYFVFNRDELEQDDGHLYTMAPPLRDESEQLKLVRHIDEIDTIGTDHCTFLSVDKDKLALKDMPLGVGGIEESFRIMYTLFGDKVIPKMTKNVAKVHKLYPQKGVIQVGSDADLFVYEEGQFEIDTFHGASDYSIYDGMPVNGRVISTISRGQFVVKNQRPMRHIGQLLHPRRDWT